MGLFVAGAACMGVLLLGFCVCLTVLMARVNGEVAKVLSESVERIFWPKARQEPSVEAEPEHLISHDLETEIYPEPSWETEDMSPYQPSSVANE